MDLCAFPIAVTVNGGPPEVRMKLTFHHPQLVISGDFTQLPPVPERDSKNGMSSVVFAFQAKSWNACMDRPVLLKKVFRQKDSSSSTVPITEEY